MYPRPLLAPMAEPTISLAPEREVVQISRLTPSAFVFDEGSISSFVSTITANVASSGLVSLSTIQSSAGRKVELALNILKLSIEGSQLDKETPQHQTELLCSRCTKQSIISPNLLLFYHIE
jgi:hypothetical protein